MNAPNEYHKGKLFCDLNTREEIIGFLQSGRAHETGIIASGVGESIAKHMAEMAQENKALREQMMLIQSAGQDAVDFIDGKHAMAGRVLDGWRKATQ